MMKQEEAMSREMKQEDRDKKSGLIVVHDGLSAWPSIDVIFDTPH